MGQKVPERKELREGGLPTPRSDRPPTTTTTTKPFPKIPKVPRAERRDWGAHAHRQETAQDVRDWRMEQRGGPKALTVGIWTGLRDRAHSRMEAESGRQAGGWGGGGGGGWRWFGVSDVAKGGRSPSCRACSCLPKGASQGSLQALSSTITWIPRKPSPQ